MDRTVGGILTLAGFGAFGKHPKNITPILIGVFIGSLAKPWNASEAAIVLAALFGTTLAPIAGQFGWHWGIVAGFIHSSAALSTGIALAGLNLYNNGFRCWHGGCRTGSGDNRRYVARERYQPALTLSFALPKPERKPGQKS